MTQKPWRRLEELFLQGVEAVINKLSDKASEVGSEGTDFHEPPACDRILKVVYTNHDKVTAIRHIMPKRIFWGSTVWHQEEQWLLECYDADKAADRIYAVKDIKAFI